MKFIFLILFSWTIAIPRAHADFVTGMVVGSLIASDSGDTIQVKDPGTPCLINLKKTGGEYTLNANYIKTVENKTNQYCTANGLFSTKCEEKQVVSITLITGEIWNTFSSIEEINSKIQKSCYRQTSSTQDPK